MQKLSKAGKLPEVIIKAYKAIIDWALIVNRGNTQPPKPADGYYCLGSDIGNWFAQGCMELISGQKSEKFNKALLMLLEFNNTLAVLTYTDSQGRLIFPLRECNYLGLGVIAKLETSGLLSAIENHRAKELLLPFYHHLHAALNALSKAKSCAEITSAFQLLNNYSDSFLQNIM